VLRRKSATPSVRSRRWTERESAGWLTPSDAAAATKLRNCASAITDRSWRDDTSFVDRIDSVLDSCALCIERLKE
jgi:hypothetical protein